MKMARCIGAALAVCLLAAAGCASLVNNAGLALDGRAFDQKTLAVYRGDGVEARRVIGRDGVEALALRVAAFPGLTLHASAPDASGIFSFVSARILSSHAGGWSEVDVELVGEGAVDTQWDRAILRAGVPPDRGAVTAGHYRLGETRASGDEALRSLRARGERVDALTGWMRERRGVPVFADRGGFAAYWRPLLLPETVSKKIAPVVVAFAERPVTGGGDGGDDDGAGDGTGWVVAEDLRWSRDYTRALFPEGLWEYRDSGALLRDWEEALEWIYLEYSWERIFAQLGEAGLEKVR